MNKLIHHMTGHPIVNIGDVRMFIWNCINQLHISFDPALPFEDYVLIDSNFQPSFSLAECAALNNTLEECHEICDREDIDMEELTLEFLNEYMGLPGN